MWRRLLPIVLFVLLFNMVTITIFHSLGSDNTILVMAPTRVDDRTNEILLVDIQTESKVWVPLPEFNRLDKVQTVGCSIAYISNKVDESHYTVINRHIADQNWQYVEAPKSTELEIYIDFELSTLSPDGQWLFVPASNAGTILNIRSGDVFMIDVAGYDIQIVERAFWSPNSKFLLWPFGTETGIVWHRFDTRTREIDSISFPGLFTYGDTRIGVWSHDGEKFATINTLRVGGDGTLSQLLAIDGETLVTQTFDFRDTIGYPIWHFDNEHVNIRGRTRSQADDDQTYILFQVDLDSEDVTPLELKPDEFQVSSIYLPERQMTQTVVADFTDHEHPVLSVVQVDAQGNSTHVTDLDPLLVELPGSGGWFWTEDGRYFVHPMFKMEWRENILYRDYMLAYGDVVQGTTEITTLQVFPELAFWLNNGRDYAYIVQPGADYRERELRILNVENGTTRNINLGILLNEYEFQTCSGTNPKKLNTLQLVAH